MGRLTLDDLTMISNIINTEMYNYMDMKKKISSSNVIESIDNYIQELCKLDSKVCGMINDTMKGDVE